MKLVLDNNILFSLMNPKSTSSYLFAMLRAQFFAPEFIKSEFEKHKDECLVKSKLSMHEFEIRQKEVEGCISFVKSSKYAEFLLKSKLALPDPDDIDFIALSLSINSPVWSNDPHFKKQSLVKVFTTKELAERLLHGDI
ncbi:MAG: PIN domain-containing protein [archaeon]